MVLFNQNNVVKGIFPNSEKQYCDLKEEIRTAPDNIFTLIYEDNSDLFDLMIMKKWFDDFSEPKSSCKLIINFCPYGQSDRPMGGAIFSFKYFAQLINSLNFDQVEICDPHSPVMVGCLNRCRAFYPMVGVYLSNYDLMFLPDSGAAKKYSEIYPSVPYRFGNKKRDLETGEIICYEIIGDKKDIEGKKIIIRDDLIIRGGTYKYAAGALRKMGAAQIDLYITHIMPSAKDFCNNYKDYGIDNFYSDNTLRMNFYKFPTKNLK